MGKKIQMNRDIIETNLNSFIDRILSLHEIECVKIRDVEIRSNSNQVLRVKEALDESFHDCYSDVDLSIVVNLSINDIVTPKEYMKHIERFGICQNDLLGICFIEENNMYRIIFKNGMRYDFGFEFIILEEADPIDIELCVNVENNPHWSWDNINRFWFTQIQALGKLYRNDFLISCHLVNINVNETLVQQMILRDIEYKTNHHRYGHCEELKYESYLNQCPFSIENHTFDYIANRLYACALAYDELAKCFYPDYEARSEAFFHIWECYKDNYPL